MRRLALILAVGAALALAACGDDDKDSTSSGSQNAGTTQTQTTKTNKSSGKKKSGSSRKKGLSANKLQNASRAERRRLREQRRTLRNILKGASKAPPEPGENLKTKKAKTSFAYARALIICSGEGLTKLARDLKVKRDPEAVAKKYADKSGLPKDVAERGCLAGLKRSKRK
jgi:hypothetical protein